MAELNLSIDPKVMVVRKKLVDMLEVFGRLDINPEAFTSALADAINRGLLSKDIRPVVSADERAERDAARDERD
jgi:hypothetical protein